MDEGTRGTGRYSGMVWDGRRWTDDAGQVQATNGWQRTSIWVRGGLIALAASVAGYAGWLYLYG